MSVTTGLEDVVAGWPNNHVPASNSANADTQLSLRASLGTITQVSKDRRNSDSRAAIAAITRGTNHGPAPACLGNALNSARLAISSSTASSQSRHSDACLRISSGKAPPSLSSSSDSRSLSHSASLFLRGFRILGLLIPSPHPLLSFNRQFFNRHVSALHSRSFAALETTEPLPYSRLYPEFPQSLRQRIPRLLLESASSYRVRPGTPAVSPPVVSLPVCR